MRLTMFWLLTFVGCTNLGVGVFMLNALAAGVGAGCLVLSSLIITEG